MVKEHECGIQDKAILFTNKCGFVYKDILYHKSKTVEEFEFLVLLSYELMLLIISADLYVKAWNEWRGL